MIKDMLEETKKTLGFEDGKKYFICIIRFYSSKSEDNVNSAFTVPLFAVKDKDDYRYISLNMKEEFWNFLIKEYFDKKQERIINLECNPADLRTSKEINNVLEYIDECFGLIIDDKMDFEDDELREVFINKLVYVFNELCKNCKNIRFNHNLKDYKNIVNYFNNYADKEKALYALFNLGLISRKEYVSSFIDNKVLYTVGEYILDNPNTKMSDIMNKFGLGYIYTKEILDRLEIANVIKKENGYIALVTKEELEEMFK